jgi:hypothetical protein
MIGRPLWDACGIPSVPAALVYPGLALLAFGLSSAAKYGRWSSHYKKRYLAEHNASGE